MIYMDMDCLFAETVGAVGAVRARQVVCYSCLNADSGPDHSILCMTFGNMTCGCDMPAICMTSCCIDLNLLIRHMERKRAWRMRALA
jgi:hypothetical protein